jgi:hypothetical protein
VEQATERAQRKIEAANRRIEQKVRDAERRGRGKAALEIGRWNWNFSPKGVPIPPKQQVSDEERLAILKMLQEKKITSEEAEKLLAALEGGSYCLRRREERFCKWSLTAGSARKRLPG